MKWIMLPALLAGFTLSGRFLAAQPSAIAQPSVQPAVQLAAQPQRSAERHDVYLSSQHGFRFTYSEGYRLDSATAYQTPTDPSLVQSLEIWKANEYSPSLYQNEATGAEWPAHITIQVLSNPDQRPLESWVGELVTSPIQATTVAGQAALSFTSTGLYEYDNVLVAIPGRPYLLKLQVGHLDAADPMRQDFRAIVDSLVFDTAVADGSIKAIDYRRLQTLLMDQDWQAADLETRTILERLVGSSEFRYPSISDGQAPAPGSDRTSVFSTVPCSDLQILNALWSGASGGQFGFAAQQAVWQAQGSTHPTAQADAFGDAVGWRQTPPTAGSLLSSEWRSDVELAYDTTAPTGHLPWIGLPSLQLERMLLESGPGCGSCTIDALYISSDRFSDILPDLFDRLDQCLCSASTTSKDGRE